MDETEARAEESLEQVVYGVLWRSLRRFLRPYPIALWPGLRHAELARTGAADIMRRVEAERERERRELTVPGGAITMSRPQGFKGIVWDGLMNGEPLRDVLDSADKRIKALVLDPIKQEYDAALRRGDTATANALERVAQKVNEL